MTSDTSDKQIHRAVDLVDLSCGRCVLAKARTQVVPAEGRPSARLFLVGEAPGPDEDAEGRPFIGRAGRILRRCIEAAGIHAEDVWISNAVKCFPHRVEAGRRRIRKPSREEADACQEWLAREIETVRPLLLVAVGGTALAQLTGRSGLKLKDARGRSLPARPAFGGRPVLATFHPSGLHYGHGTEDDVVADLRTAYALATA